MNDFIKELSLSGKRLTPDAVESLSEFIKSNDCDRQLLMINLKKAKEVIITKTVMDSIISEVVKISQPVVMIERPSDFKPIAKEYSSDVHIMKKYDITNNSRTTGSVDDFVHYFRDRYKRIRDMLKVRPSNVPLIDIRYAKKHKGEKLRIVAIINEKSMSKKGNMVIRCEDLTGDMLVVIPKDAHAFANKDTIIEDEVVMFEGNMLDTIFIANELIRPETPINKEVKRIDDDLAIAYISDLHVGSDMFLEDAFKEFIQWLNGKGKDKELAGKVKYLIVAGDIADGIGIYPQQENELVIKDVFEQYDLFVDLMNNIPDYIKIIVAPGNHDAVRRAEPQPAIPREMIGDRFIRISNPGWVKIEGLTHLIYHGRGLDAMVSNLPHMSFSEPEKSMVEMLIRRHLSPMYGKNLIIPEEKDYLVIHEVPDVFHTAHVHKNAYKLYKGIHLVNSGTFQARTPYQVKLGHVPTPGIVPVLELKTGIMHTIKF